MAGGHFFPPIAFVKIQCPIIGAKLIGCPYLLRMSAVNLEKNASLTLVCEPAG